MPEQKSLFAMMPSMPARNNIPGRAIGIDRDNPIWALINRRRRQMLVHSALYYKMDMPLISDETFDKWALELVDLQKKHPDIAARVPFHDDFRNFTGATGFNLPYDTDRVMRVVFTLLDISGKRDQAIKELVKDE